MQRINRLIRCLSEYQFQATMELRDWNVRRAYYANLGQYVESELNGGTASVGDWLADSGTTVFLETEAVVPRGWARDRVALLFKADGKGKRSNCEALFSLGGMPLQGLDRNRDLVRLPASSLTERLSLVIELFNPAAIPDDHLRGANTVSESETNPPPVFMLKSALVLLNPAVQSLSAAIEVVAESAVLLPEQSPQRKRMHQALDKVADELEQRLSKLALDFPSLLELEKELLSEVGSLAGFRPGIIRAIGQSHIDTAWLWPIKETIRKCSRTFSTVCTLLDENPNFLYTQSQPQLFAYVKEHYPKVYERVKEKIAEGRFELVGGMWVEPDLNIPSGESLVRQLLYGKAFYKKEFGIESMVEWLPDTFGYCASLPQILKKAGTDYFMTTKLNWNDTNRFPNDLFEWEGIDGTRIISYLHTILNQETHPKDIYDTWNDYKQQTEFPERMLTYGYGDGGGGVTREMLARLDRSVSLPGLPDVRYEKVHRFFDRVTEKAPSLPVWYGDLYLELHRGTYTTHAEVKRNNRKAEALYREAEIWSSFAWGALGEEYPSKELEKGWKLLLLNQFHDIVPGTSIASVYDLSREQFSEVFSIGEKLRTSALKRLSSALDTNGPGEPVVLFNSLSWPRSETILWIGGQELLNAEVVDEHGYVYESDVTIDENGAVVMTVFVSDIPGMGCKTVWLRKRKGQSLDKSSNSILADGRWETPIYSVMFDKEGRIARLFDKRFGKEVIKPGEVGNELQLFNDMPLDWDAWDIDPKFAGQRVGKAELMSTEVVVSGNVHDRLRFKWRLSESVVTQDIIFYRHNPRIDFETSIEWNESHKLLKVAFPVHVRSAKAAYEIPFGSVERPTHNNTSWEQAQYEVCGHRWADLSDGSYGVSLLNDCKYGYDIKGSVMRLSLLRAPKWPDVSADIGTHRFVYSLYPHEGDWRSGDTVKRGYELNNPIAVLPAVRHQGELPSTYSWLSVESKSVIIDTVKRAERENKLIARMYESAGGERPIYLEWGIPILAVEETNLLEEPEGDIPIRNGVCRARLQPYEIKTFMIKISDSTRMV